MDLVFTFSLFPCLTMVSRFNTETSLKKARTGAGASAAC